MKKIILSFLAVWLVLGLAGKVQATGNAYWSGPDTVRAGDTVTVTFYAGGGIHGGSCSIQYDETKLTLQSFRQQVGDNWAVERAGNNFVFYDNSTDMSNPIADTKAIFSLTFLVSGSVQTGEQLTISATGVTLSDGQKDMGLGTVSYTKTVAQPLSDNCDLQALNVAGVTLSPAFSASTTRYSAYVPFSTTSVSISWTTAHTGAKVSVQNPNLTAGETTTLSVTVTAEKGNTKTYYIAITRGQDPNYVPDNNCRLSSLEVEGYQLSPVFDPDVTGYYVWLPYETEQVTLQAAAESPKAKVELPVCENLPAGEGTELSVMVIAEDGTQKIYRVVAVRAPSYEETEAFLQGQREPEPTEPPTTEPTEPAEPPVSTVPPTTAPVDQPPVVEQKTDITPWLLALAIAEGMVILVLLLIKKKW